MSLNVSRRHLLLGLAAGTTGCASALQKIPYVGAISAAISGSKVNPLINRGASDRIPYANIHAWFDGAAHAVLVLVDVSGDGTLTWMGGNNKSISTRGPIVTRTIGFDVDLTSVRFETELPLDIRSMVGGQYKRTMSYMAGRPIEVQLKSRFIARGQTSIEIFGKNYQVDEVHERVSARGTHRFTNRYWIDSTTGFCWKSAQTPIPDQPVLNLELLKPYRPS